MEVVKTPWQSKVLKTGYFILILSVIFLGTYTRIGPQLTRDYWIDEIWRISEISNTFAYSNVTQPVNVGDFYLTKAVWSLLGEQEVTSRLVPCVASILTLILLGWYSWNHFSPPVAVLITAIAATAPGMIEHGYEFKPYSLETLMCVISLIVFSKRNARSRLRLPFQLFFLTLLIALAFSTVPFLSFLFIFALFSTLKESRSQLIKVGGLAILLGLAVSSYRYVSFMTPLSAQHGMWKFWQPYYLQDLEQVKFFVFDRLPELLSWYVLPIPGLTQLPGLLVLVVTLLICTISVLITLADRNSFFVWIFFPPLVMMLLAVFGKYPFGTRVSAFYYPILLLSLGYFVNQLYLYMSVRPKTLAPFLQVTILLSASWFSFQWTPRENPGAHKHIQVSKELFRFLGKNGSEDDFICLSGHARMLIDYYGTSNKLPLDPPCELPAPREPNKNELDEFIAELPATNGSYWFMAVHRDRGYELLKQELIRQGLSIQSDLRRPSSFLIQVKKTPTSPHPD
ncbi:MAG: hypothetical protein KDD62_04930 [Bdellovibrionales bacterium]|nr:hypothetical protein [Bdellovibrionales bacterium]